MDDKPDGDAAQRHQLGRELVKRRKAAELTQRELAAQLHVERSYVAHSESGRMLPPARFWESADRLLGAGGALRSLFAQLRPAPVPGAQRHRSDVFDDASSFDPVGQRAVEDNSRFDHNSRRRTLEIARRIDVPASASRLPYIEPVGRLRALREFLERAGQRVYVLTGVAGSGKSRLVSQLSRQLDGVACFQLHSTTTWEPTGPALVDEMLRYASIGPGSDGLLTLERVCLTLERTCLVTVDGIASREQFEHVAASLERILRQVTTPRLKFLLVVRTPPDVEFSAFPVLAASVHEPSGASTTLARWTEAEAAHAWALATRDDEPSFADLPSALRRLAATPLYLRLMVDFSLPDALTGATAYQLVDHCVRTIVRRCGTEHLDVFRTLAQASGSQDGGLIPDQLDRTDHDPDGNLAHPALAPLLEVLASGRIRFVHEVIREYFVATRIAELVIEHGRSQAIVSAFNDLSKAAGISASARNILDFTIFALDERAPELLTTVALAPSVSAGSTLPPMMSIAAAGARFGTAPVIRAAARHCVNDEHPMLVRELLRLPDLAAALGERYPDWLLQIVRDYGPQSWPDVARHLSRFPETEGADKLRRVVELDRARDAVFVARHVDLFVGEGTDGAALLAQLTGHLDWRVRAALTGARGGDVAPRLARDADYKVRASAARVLAGNIGSLADDQLRDVLLDPNWHVRAAFLRGTLDASSLGVDLSTIHHFVTSDPGWRDRPLHVGKLVERLGLLSGVIGPTTDNAAYRSALLIVLKELRSGSLTVPAQLRGKLVEHAAGSPDWLVRTEAALLTGNGGAAPSPSETYRRMRGGAAVQVALDLPDLGHARSVAEAAAEAGADLIEVGDPLIKSVGLRAITEIKRAVPETRVVAEMMSADWGRDQVELAVEVGADIVLLIGPATTASVAAAATASRRLGAPLVLDIPSGQLTQEWVSEMERAGVDGFAVTTNIDMGVGGHQPLDVARTVRNWTRLPVSVSGGFDTNDHGVACSNDWDVIIVGRSVSEAVRPLESVRQILDLVHDQKGRNPDAGDPAQPPTA